MDSRRAQEILLRYRPGLGDDHEPEMRAALDLVKKDPELAGWFVAQCAWQKTVRERLRSLEAPASVREQILAAAPAEPRVLWWRPALAWAAILALFCGGWWYWQQIHSGNGFSAYRTRMVATALRDYRMNMISRDQAEIRRFLQQNSKHGDYQLPRPLQQLPGAGAALLSWQGKPVSLICLDSGGQTNLFLFVMNRADLTGAPHVTRPQFAQVNKLSTVAWEEQGKVYLLAGFGDLDRYFP